VKIIEAIQLAASRMTAKQIPELEIAEEDKDTHSLIQEYAQNMVTGKPISERISSSTICCMGKSSGLRIRTQRF